MKTPKNIVSLATVGLVIIVLTATVFNLSKWKNNGVLAHDMYVYYSYLPATFIYKDYSFAWGGEIPKDSRGEVWCLPTDNGGCVQKMTMGMAYLYLPFFLIAHALALLLDLEPHGYSSIYHQMMAIGTLIYAMFSLLLQRSILLRYFKDWTTAITLAGIFLGTNLFFYVTNEGPMSHSYNFFLFSCFLFLTLKWFDHKKLKHALLLGVIGGIITLIRPTNILLFLIPLLWNINSWQLMVERLLLFKNKFLHIIAIAIAAFLVIFPQLLYWKESSGDWIYYSYNDETFFFSDPQILNGLLSFRKGWLIYTPIMTFSLIGFFYLKQIKHQFQIGIGLYLILHIYIAFSWWCWWYGGSFGARPMIETYALLSIPFAAFVQHILQKEKIKVILLSLATFLFIGLNLFQSLQYKYGILHYHGMTKEAYFGIFGKINYPEGYDQMIKDPDYDAAKKGFRRQ